MNERDHEQIVELLPGYALGALDPDDVVVVETYLATHPEAQREVEALRETFGQLAFAVPPLPPPPGAKAALFARIERQGGAPTSGATPAPALPSVPPAPLPLRRQESASVPIPIARRWPLALAAVAAVLALALTGWNISLQQQVGTQQQEVTALNAQLSAQADSAALGRLVNEQQFARPLSASSGDGAYGTTGPAGYLYADLAGSLALLNCYWMPTLQANQVYQVWLLRADGTRDSGGTFNVDSRGNASVVIRAPTDFRTYTSVGVTAEPAPGSTGPTTARVVWADLK